VSLHFQERATKFSAPYSTHSERALWNHISN